MSQVLHAHEGKQHAMPQSQTQTQLGSMQWHMSWMGADGSRQVRGVGRKPVQVLGVLQAGCRQGAPVGNAITGACSIRQDTHPKLEDD